MSGVTIRIAARHIGLVLALLGLSLKAWGAGPVTVRLAFPSVADLADVPVLVAGERLRAQGIVLEPLFLSNESLVIQAVLRGDADIGTGASRGTLAAMQQGARLMLFATQQRLLWTMYARRDVVQCQDLNGKRLALHSHGGISTALVRGWLRDRCPSASPVVTIIPGSENRMAALLAGQIDVTPLELSDAMQVDEARPGQFHRLADFGKDFPWLLNTILFTTPSHLSSRRDVVKALTRDLIRAYRDTARDPDFLARIAPRYIKVYNPALLPGITRAYVEAGIWPTDGGFNERLVERTIQFFVDLESIKPGLKAAQVGDYSIVREVLEQAGQP